jgi:hypothetical protein
VRGVLTLEKAPFEAIDTHKISGKKDVGRPVGQIVPRGIFKPIAVVLLYNNPKDSKLNLSHHLLHCFHIESLRSQTHNLHWRFYY